MELFNAVAGNNNDYPAWMGWLAVPFLLLTFLFVRPGK